MAHSDLKYGYKHLKVRIARSIGDSSMIKVGQTALALIVVVLVSVAPGARADKVVIGTVGSASANLWPLFIGLNKGFFAAANVDVDLVYVPASAAVIQQLTAGSLDVTMSTGLVTRSAPSIAGRDRACALRDTGAALRDDGQINRQRLEDLKGKVISVGGAKDITRIYAERMLAPHGLKSGDYDFVYAGATTARAQALLSGAVDAAILLPPSNFQVQAAGFNDVGLTIEYAPELAFSGTVVTNPGPAAIKICSSACWRSRAGASRISTTRAIVTT